MNAWHACVRTVATAVYFVFGFYPGGFRTELHIYILNLRSQISSYMVSLMASQRRSLFLISFPEKLMGCIDQTQLTITQHMLHRIVHLTLHREIQFIIADANYLNVDQDINVMDCIVHNCAYCGL